MKCFATLGHFHSNLISYFLGILPAFYAVCKTIREERKQEYDRIIQYSSDESGTESDEEILHFLKESKETSNNYSYP